MSARNTALRILSVWRKNGFWSDDRMYEAIQSDGLNPQDARLCTAICYGVLQNLILLDYRIKQCTTSRRHLQPLLQDILRIGAYQILLLDRVPDSAAVNSCVEMAKKAFSKNDAGLVNAVLRTLSKKKDVMEIPRDYSIRYSHPPELVDLIKASAGKNLKAVLEADNKVPDICVFPNLLKTNHEELASDLCAAGISVFNHIFMQDAVLLRNPGDLTSIPAFTSGACYVQDPAARLSVDTIPLEPGYRVLDLCSAPGGKSFASAMKMGDQGEIVSCDISAYKLEKVKNGAERMGISCIQTRENDATVPNPAFSEAFDVVIADVPCSGIGVIRKKPDIRYRKLDELGKLPPLQRKILQNAADCVRPGGYLMYSTCTILREENEENVEDFLRKNPDFHLCISDIPIIGRSGMVSLLQGVHDCDGFFFALMQRTV